MYNEAVPLQALGAGIWPRPGRSAGSSLGEATVQGCDLSQAPEGQPWSLCWGYQETGRLYLVAWLSQKASAWSYRQTVYQHKGKACLEPGVRERRQAQTHGERFRLLLWMCLDSTVPEARLPPDVSFSA